MRKGMGPREHINSVVSGVFEEKAGGLIDRLFADMDGGATPMTLAEVRAALEEVGVELISGMRSLPMEREELAALEEFMGKFLDFVSGLILDQLSLIDTSCRAFVALADRMDILEAQVEVMEMNGKNFSKH